MTTDERKSQPKGRNSFRRRLTAGSMAAACALGVVGGSLLSEPASAELKFVTAFSASGQLTQGQNDINNNVGSGLQYLADYGTAQRTRTSVGPTGFPLVCQWQAYSVTRLPNGNPSFSTVSSYQGNCGAAKWNDWNHLKGVYDALGTKYGHSYKSQDTGGAWTIVGDVSA